MVPLAPCGGAVGNRLTSPVSQTSAILGIDRRIGAWVPHFSAVAPLLARSDLIATLPTAALVDANDMFGLRAASPPFVIAPMPHVVVWSTRHANDGGLSWLRHHLETVWADMLVRADRVLSA